MTAGQAGAWTTNGMPKTVVTPLPDQMSTPMPRYFASSNVGKYDGRTTSISVKTAQAAKTIAAEKRRSVASLRPTSRKPTAPGVPRASRPGRAGVRGPGHARSGDKETPGGTDRSAGSVFACASTCDSVFRLTPVRLLRRRCKHLRRRWRSAPAPSGKTYDIRRASPSPSGLSTSFGVGGAYFGVPSTSRPHRCARGMWTEAWAERPSRTARTRSGLVASAPATLHRVQTTDPSDPGRPWILAADARSRRPWHGSLRLAATFELVDRPNWLSSSRAASRPAGRKSADRRRRPGGPGREVAGHTKTPEGTSGPVRRQ